MTSRPDDDHAAAPPRPTGIDPTNADTWPEILTLAQTAQILGIGPTAARRQVAAGQIEAVKFGDQWRVSKRWLVEKFRLRP